MKDIERYMLVAISWHYPCTIQYTGKISDKSAVTRWIKKYSESDAAKYYRFEMMPIRRLPEDVRVLYETLNS